MVFTITGKQCIAGELVQDGDYPFYSPRPTQRGQGNIPFANASTSAIHRAVEAAVEAYIETRLYSADKLAAFLDTAAYEFEALGDALLQITHAETALPIPRLASERERTTGQLRKFGQLLREGTYVEAIIDTAMPNRQPAPRPAIHRMLIPIGVVAVFSASNFPYAFAVAGGDTASAFAAGCPVIVKAHPGHPETSELSALAINRAIEKSGFPPGFFSLIQGNQHDVGQALITHPDVSAVGFTGSLRAGRAIFDAAAARSVPIPVYAEMGSINPIVLLPEAIKNRADTIAKGLTESVTLGTGQFCTKPGVVFVIGSAETDAFIQLFTEKMREAQPGTLLNAAIENGLTQAVKETLSRGGVEKLLGGEPLDSTACGYAHTVLLSTSTVFRADRALQAEHFGPVILFVVSESLDDLAATLAVLEGNLTATIHAEAGETEIASALYNILREKVGRLIWNGFPTGVEVAHAMQHGGPYPATTTPATTSVGMTSIKRFMRPLAFQNIPDALLPPALQNSNPLGIWRLVDGVWTKNPILSE